MDFKVGDKVKCSAMYGSNRWRGIVMVVGVGQVRIRKVGDKNKRNEYWVRTENLLPA